MKWSDIPALYKAASTVVVAFISIASWMWVTFEHADAAEQKWATHNKQIACSNVLELEEKIRALKRERKIASEDRKKEIDEDVQWYRDRIKGIDPNGDCE